ncbi:hypothetical protein [Parasediminibacterium sp. JCM 36343]|uniref:hypothetical protein n=1 Tax=Parasediminibacterium sp. JCM 36343 TaxID=3374279 RepID=UPI00397AD847
MKRMLALLLATGMFALASNAQDAPPPPPTGKPPMMMTKEEKAKMKQRRDEELATTFKEAGLTDDQSKQAKDAQDDYNTKMHDLKKDATMSDDDKKTKMKDLKDAQVAKLKEIMGDKYKAWVESRKKMMQSHMPPPPPAPAP